VGVGGGGGGREEVRGGKVGNGSIVIVRNIRRRVG
jgi:hypothetical protein